MTHLIEGIDSWFFYRQFVLLFIVNMAEATDIQKAALYAVLTGMDDPDKPKHKKAECYHYKGTVESYYTERWGTKQSDIPQEYHNKYLKPIVKPSGEKRIFVDCDDGYYSTMVKVNFCPYCGEDFRDKPKEEKHVTQTYSL